MSSGHMLLIKIRQTALITSPLMNKHGQIIIIFYLLTIQWVKTFLCQYLKKGVGLSIVVGNETGKVPIASSAWAAAENLYNFLFG